MFKIFFRTNNEAEWELYGEFTAEQWNREQGHIRFLRSMGPLYLRQIRCGA
jgi:hypothetical protein